jgi:hypothetical protein
MPIAFPTPDHMPCPDCGASVPVANETEHICEAERLLDFRLVELRDEIDSFDAEYAAWLETPGGRFACFVAERYRP